ncbi:MAG: GNAT family N-acetyltransferase [Clostridia bacterium]|nr:GNAT family N-acetyltransferase [Clostridia bacterium]
MELRPIPNRELQSWYDAELTEAFPPNERKPLQEIRDLIGAGRYDLFGLYDGAALLGYAGMMKHPGADYVLLDYLGVTAARRSGGLGAEIIRRLGEQCANRPGVITEAETPIPGDSEEENALRLRRIGFYRRCGFHPVYEMASCGARFQALLLGEIPEDMTKLMADHKTVYGPLRTDVKVPITPGEIPARPYWMQ